MATKLQKVMRPQQRTDQRPQPGELRQVVTHKLALDQHGQTGGKADEAAEGAEIEPAHQPVVLAREDHGLL
jgi:hypothetical protein